MSCRVLREEQIEYRNQIDRRRDTSSRFRQFQQLVGGTATESSLFHPLQIADRTESFASTSFHGPTVEVNCAVRINSNSQRKCFPMSMSVSRRTFFAATAASVAAGSLTSPQLAHASPDSASPFRFCLNTSTIRECQYQGKKIDILGGIEVASKAGYTGIEPWIREIDAYVKNGGTVSELRKRIADAGLTVEARSGSPPFCTKTTNNERKDLKKPNAAWDLSEKSAALASPLHRWA